MKKTLAAVAVLGAFAGSALAADVTLYGLVDTGFAYNHVDSDKANTDATDSFGMKSGMGSGPRFGLKGVEDLGDGLKVGFILENQFNSDDGTLKTPNTLFHREASLFLEGGFGKLAFGRIGSINQGTGSFAQLSALSAFGTSTWGGYAANIDNTIKGGAVQNNMIAYASPVFAGVQVFAQYAMGANDQENESSSDRYYAIGATYKNGPLSLLFSVDSTNYKSYGEYTSAEDKAVKTVADVDDSYTITFGGNYDFEVVKVYAGVQYFDNVVPFGALLDFSDLYVKGFGANVSLSAPVAGGTAMFGLGYVDGEVSQVSAFASQKPGKDAADKPTPSAADTAKDLKDAEFKRYVVSVGYDYNLSKRTDVYAVASYMQDKIDYNNTALKDRDPSACTVAVGLRHKF